MPERAEGETNHITGPPSLLRNTLSIIGIGVASLAAINIAFLVFIDYFHPSPYVGIFAYMILPAILILGLALIESLVLLSFVIAYFLEQKIP